MSLSIRQENLINSMKANCRRITPDDEEFAREMEQFRFTGNSDVQVAICCMRIVAHYNSKAHSQTLSRARRHLRKNAKQ